MNANVGGFDKWVRVVVGALLIGFKLGFRCRWDFIPLAMALGVFILAFAVMLSVLFPLIVPPGLSLQAAAASPGSQTVQTRRSPGILSPYGQACPVP